MAAVRLIESLLSEAGGAAGGGGGGTKGQQLEEIGESPDEGGGGAGQGLGVSLNPSAVSSKPQTFTFQDIFVSKIDKFALWENVCALGRSRAYSPSYHQNIRGDHLFSELCKSFFRANLSALPKKGR